MPKLTDLLKGSRAEQILSPAFLRWALAVSAELDASRVWVDFATLKYPDPADPAYPPIAVGGPTQGHVYLFGMQAYIENPLRSDRDRTTNVIVGIGWAPLATEAKVVRWQCDVGLESVGHDVTQIDLTRNVDDPVGIALQYHHAPLILTPTDLALNPAADEIHVRFTYVNSGNAPVNPPGLHHVAVVQYLL